MSIFEVHGGKKLKGEITPQGAKNEALQVICATLLTSEEIKISNIPSIHDINILIEILKDLGVCVTKTGDEEYIFKADNINLSMLDSKEFQRKISTLRGSIMLLGPLLSRFGKAIISKPGGDKIGRRRIDTHIHGLIMLGAKCDYNSRQQIHTITADTLKGSYILLDEASVTGTANIIMGAVLAHGKTTIYNAACEPYTQQLCKMLISMGAIIEGVGSNLLIITGVSKLGGCKHRLLSDMIEVGSFIGLAAITQSEITIKKVNYEQLGIIPDVFKQLGIQMERKNDDIFIPAQKKYEIENYIDGSILTISDAPWPGFTPDLLSIALVIATQAKGTVLIHQKMFESRLFFVDKLIDMGAQIILCDPHRATVIGSNRQNKLRGITMTSPDIRAGVSLLLAALSADGKSTIDNIEQIDRGYKNIDGRLRALGADITRKLL